MAGATTASSQAPNRYAAVKRCSQQDHPASRPEGPALGGRTGIYTLWRGGTCLGYFEERTPVTGQSGRVGAYGVLVPTAGTEDMSPMMQTRFETLPYSPTFQDSLPIDWISIPPRPPIHFYPGSGALEPLSPDAARGVRPDKVYEIRDERGEKLDVDLVTVELHRFASAALAKEWRDANGIQGDAQEYWTVTFASHRTSK